LLAAGGDELYPNVKLGIGPPVTTDFFNEFLREQPFTPEIWKRSKRRCAELAAQDLPNERKLLRRRSDRPLQETNQVFKCELVEEKATEPMVSFYTTGKFIDFCRGPHILRRSDSGVQVDGVAGAVLDGPRKARATAADLCGGVFHTKRAG